MKVFRRMTVSIAIVLFVLTNIFIIFNIKGTYEPEVLLPTLNIIFIGIFPIIISYLYASIHVEEYSIGALLLFCGLFVYGLGSILAGLLRTSVDGANKTVTLHNSACLLSAICHFISSMLDEKKQLKVSKKKRIVQIISINIGFVAFFCILIYGINKQWTPRFVEKDGYSQLRQLVLWFSVICYSSSAAVLIKKYQEQKSNHFLLMYASMLIMIAIGLYGVINSPTVGGYIGWLGRISQYYGGFVGFFSAITLKKYSRKQDDIRIALSGFYSNNQDHNSIEFEQFILMLSKRFINSPLDDLDEAIIQSMRVIAEYSDSDKVTIWSNSSEKTQPNKILEWMRQPENDVEGILRKFLISDYNVAVDDYLKGRVYIRSDFPEQQQYRISKVVGIKMLCLYPILDNGQAVGMISFAKMAKGKTWDQCDIMRIKVFGDIVASVYLRKRIQEELLISEHNALSLVQDLKQADENKNEFINMMSHELRNPLAAISMGLSLLDLTNDEQITKNTMEIIRRQTLHLCRLVDDLLDISRITNNTIVLNKEKVEINKLVNSIVQDFQTQFNEKRISLKKEIPSELIILNADPVRITQVMCNLLLNALKFTKDGGETTVILYKDNLDAIICVKDNGIGIHPDDQSRLFQPFVQLHHSIDRKDGGLGLGLAIVKKVVELHDGSVNIRSEGVGEGTELLIRFPLYQQTGV